MSEYLRKLGERLDGRSPLAWPWYLRMPGQVVAGSACLVFVFAIFMGAIILAIVTGSLFVEGP